jgi:hypothetical protein
MKLDHIHEFIKIKKYRYTIVLFVLVTDISI